MLFNSFDFLWFLPCVFLVYHFLLKQRGHQNLFLVLASYTFYGWWDWRFCFLIFISTAADYLIGDRIFRTGNPRVKKRLLQLSLLINLGILGFFKYFNFFVENWVEAWSQIGIDFHPATIQIILPVGISFYTFQTLSYTIDIYRGRQEPTRDLVSFAAFVSFFPQLVAGPIERARDLLPQFLKQRKIDSHLMIDGTQQIIWGFFKKMVIADNCAVVVDQIFSQPQEQSGMAILLAGVLFAIQVYGDFSGYSDIAIGTGKLFGFRLTTNFKTPFFSRNIPELFNRWHVTLMSWFREYVFQPLGGMRGSPLFRLRNVFAVFLLSGLWHGAGWNFILWGGLFAFFFIPHVGFFGSRPRSTKSRGRFLDCADEGSAILITFFIFAVSALFFRGPDLIHCLQYFDRIFFHFSGPVPFHPVYFGLVFLFAIEWVTQKFDHPFSGLADFSIFSYAAPAIVLVATVLFHAREPLSFVYFQF